jgi:hypothetical protein
VVGQSVIFLFEKTCFQNNIMKAMLVQDKDDIFLGKYITNSYPQGYYNSTVYNRFRLFFEKNIYNLILKIDASNDNHRLGFNVKFRSGLIAKNGQNTIKSNTRITKYWGKGIFSGSSVNRFFVTDENEYLCYEKKLIKSGGTNTVSYFEEKLLLRQTGDRLICAYDNKSLLATNNVHIGNKISENTKLKYILALLNSRLLDFYYKTTSLEQGRTMAQIDIDIIENLPIPHVSDGNEEPIKHIEKLVDKILAAKAVDHKADTSALERQIDNLVYRLYNLTYDEVKVIEPEFPLSRAEYENIRIEG